MHPQVRRQVIDMDEQERDSSVVSATFYKTELELAPLKDDLVFVDENKDFQLYCDACNMPTLYPEHAHYKCSNCGARTSCCEGS